MTEGQDHQTHEHAPEPGVAARAGAAIDRVGGRLGALAAETGSQLRELTARAGAAAAGDTPRADGDTPGGTTEQPPVARADAALDQVGERIGGVLALVGLQVRRAVARTREEAEDMWAEAQGVRRDTQL